MSKSPGPPKNGAIAFLSASRQISKTGSKFFTKFLKFLTKIKILGRVWTTQAVRVKESHRGCGLSKLLDNYIFKYLKEKFGETPEIMSMSMLLGEF